jgi:hypothetical protein
MYFLLATPIPTVATPSVGIWRVPCTTGSMSAACRTLLREPKVQQYNWDMTADPRPMQLPANARNMKICEFVRTKLLPSLHVALPDPKDNNSYFLLAVTSFCPKESKCWGRGLNIDRSSNLKESTAGNNISVRT